MIVTIEGNELEQSLLEAKVSLLDFWAKDCTYCLKLNPVLESLDEEMGDKLVIAKINVDTSPAIAEKYRVRSLPTLILLLKGEQKQKILGFKTLQQLHQILAPHMEVGED